MADQSRDTRVEWKFWPSSVPLNSTPVISLSPAAEVALCLSYLLNVLAAIAVVSCLCSPERSSFLALTSRRKFPPCRMAMRNGHAGHMHVDSPTSSGSPGNTSKKGAVFSLLASKLCLVRMTFVQMAVFFRELNFCFRICIIKLR